jgi:hypothetical protein
VKRRFKLKPYQFRRSVHKIFWFDEAQHGDILGVAQGAAVQLVQFATYGGCVDFAKDF